METRQKNLFFQKRNRGGEWRTARVREWPCRHLRGSALHPLRSFFRQEARRTRRPTTPTRGAARISTRRMMGGVFRGKHRSGRGINTNWAVFIAGKKFGKCKLGYLSQWETFLRRITGYGDFACYLFYFTLFPSFPLYIRSLQNL